VKIAIDGQSYQVNSIERALLCEYVRQMALCEYEKLPGEYRLLSKPIARKILQCMERDIRAKYGKERSLSFRPGKRVDPTVFLTGIMASILQEALQHVQIDVQTNADSIASFSCTITGQGESRRQMAVDGNIGKWENNRAEIPGFGVYAPVSNGAPLPP
jgi:hypothetical protein